MDTKVCPRCKCSKPLNDFAKNSHKADGLQTHCRVCKKETDAEHYRANKDRQLERNRANYRRYREEIDAIKAAQGCSVCGESDACCLDFHHPDNDKEGNVSAMLTQVGRRKLLEEIAKCVIVCANCHRKFHAGKIILPS